MFSDKFKNKALDLCRVHNISDFGLNLDECQIVFSKNLKYGVIYTEGSIVIIDMNKKSLLSKFSNEKNSRIYKLKITHKNIITYINRTSEHTNIVISSIDFIGYFFELRVPNDIQDYVYVETPSEDGSDDYIFTVTSKGE